MIKKMNPSMTCGLKVIAAAFALISLAACHNDDSEQRAAELLQTARQQADQKQYAASLATIDTLRSRYPKAIEARKEALRLHQDVEQKRAQAELEQTDKALQRVKSEYDTQKRRAEQAHANGTATAMQLTNVTRLRMKRDSLQVQFDMQCAKIKYIRMKMKEKD